MITRKVNYRDLSEAFFPVEEQPIFSYNGKIIPGYKSIVDRNTGRSISVVSSQYRLMRNIDAYNLADYVVKEVFIDKTLQDFICYNIHMPQTKASCRIDLIIPNNFGFLFGNEKESWIPFVRISNSYNRTVALKFELGFCRWICKNGVIFGQTGISFTANHSTRIKYEDIDNLVKRTRNTMGTVTSLWSTFESKMEELRSIPLPSSLALEFFCKVFEIRAKKDQLTPLQKEGLLHRAEQIISSSREYFNEQGDNAYAMMNVLTDFASFPEWTHAPSNYIDGYQRRVGKWIDEFTAEYKKKGFNLNDYIGDDCRNTAYFLRSLYMKSHINGQ